MSAVSYSGEIVVPLLITESAHRAWMTLKNAGLHVCDKVANGPCLYHENESEMTSRSLTSENSSNIVRILIIDSKNILLVSLRKL